MIDVKWFERVASFARPDLSGRDREKLCKELGELYEVLPFIVTAGGFADWPLTRVAMKAAAMGLTRPSHVRPADADTLPPVLGRPHMREQMDRMLDAHDVRLSLKTDGPSASAAENVVASADDAVRSRELDTRSGPLAEHVAALVRAARSSAYGNGEDPSLYILAE